jgi:proteic killer suppression protein
MIRSFKHKGLEKFFLANSRKGIQPKHATKLTDILTVLDAASVLASMDVPGWELNGLKGDEAGTWSVKVNGNWRVTFLFTEKTDENEGYAEIVDYRDYH